MKTFLGFVVKEFKQITRDRRTLVVLFGMPIIMMILFGFAIRNEINEAKIGILDHSKDEVTRSIIEKIESSESFTVSANISSVKEIEAIFQQGNIKAILVFETDFEEKLMKHGSADIQIVTDATDPNLANLLQSYSGLIVRDYVEELNARQGYQIQEAGIQPKIRMLYNPELRSVNLFVPGLIAVILMLISTLMTSISITREKEMGNMEILLVSPLKPNHIIIGKVLPYLVMSVINVITILLLAYFVFGVPFKGSYLFFFFEAGIFIMAALALGVFISTAANNQQTAMMISLAGLLLPTVLLSGFIFPVQSMPVPLQLLSHVVPAKWFLIIVRGIMLKGSDIFLLWKETLILVIMTLFFIGLSLKKFKVRLQ
jgi:ABC-2 type transport system permease protein